MAELTEQQDQEAGHEGRREVTYGRTPESGGGSSGITGRDVRDGTPENRGEASGRERRLERDNATLMRALARGVEHREALDRAGELDRAATSRQTGAPVGTNCRTVHIGTNLFLEEMRNEGPLPLPEPVSKSKLEGKENWKKP
ncbi:hypothetical protein ACLB2K_037251 [Fragaria x ananassa]